MGIGGIKMSDNNIEEKEILEEEAIEEETAVESVSLESEAQEELHKPKVSFIKSLSAAVLDSVIVGIISIVVFYIFDVLLKLGGYYVAQKISMIFLLFVVVSILYTSIMEAQKNGITFGKKLLNI
jgi:uncharacterized RDD family membrane protein YckC